MVNGRSTVVVRTLIAAALLLPAGACGTVEPGSVHDRGTIRGSGDLLSPRTNPDIDVQGVQLAHGLAFGAPIRARVGGMFEVQVPVANESVENIIFEYRFEFLDAVNQPLKLDMEWKPAALAAAESATLRAGTRHPTASNYRLRVRLLDDDEAIAAGSSD